MSRGCPLAVLLLHARGAPVANPLGKEQQKLQIGVLGGSISWGQNVKERERYSNILARSLNATVINAAVPATGVSTASLCLETLLPEWRSLDVFVIEYAFNDALRTTPVHVHDGSNKYLEPLPSLERLLCTLLLQPDRSPPLVIVLAVCEFIHSKCQTLFHDVTEDYRMAGVIELSIWDAPAPKPGRPFFNHSQAGHWHPTNWGHSAIATLLQGAISILREPVTRGASKIPLVPRCLHDEFGAPWHCLACSYDVHGCPGLRPARADGFALHNLGRSDEEGRGHPKTGWRGVSVGSSLVVALGYADAPRRVVLEALCSYENVGHAIGWLTTTSDPVSHVRVKIDFRWNMQSSQHCLMPITTAPAYANSSLHLEIDSNEGGARGDNQVKVFGVLTQVCRRETC
jgi:hypothetical protein